MAYKIFSPSLHIVDPELAANSTQQSKPENLQLEQHINKNGNGNDNFIITVDY